MFLCGLTVGVWSVFINPFRTQLKAIELAEKLGGKVVLQKAQGASWHEWLVTTWLGENAFVEVHNLDLRETKVTNEHLATIGSMRHLTELVMDGCDITDTGLFRLSGMHELESASLRYTGITNSGLKALSMMHGLQSLQLTGTKVDDEGLKAISHLSSLNDVYARWTRVTTSGAAELRKSLPDCQVHVQTLQD
jgi:hypothetical protein